MSTSDDAPLEPVRPDLATFQVPLRTLTAKDWGPVVLLFGLGMPAALASVLYEEDPTVVLVITSIFVAFAAVYWWRLPREGPILVLGPDRLLLPRRATESGRLKASWADARGVEIIDFGLVKVMVFDVGRLVVLPLGAFPKHVDPVTILAAARERFAAASTPAALAAWDRRAALARARFPGWAPATLVVAAVWVAMSFVMQQDGWHELSYLLGWSGSARSILEDAQVWRLATSGLVHAGVLHLLSNVTALLSFGALLEHMVGTARTLVVLLGGIVAASLVSALTSDGIASLGGSGGVFAVVAAVAVVHLRSGEQLPAGWRQPWWLWALLAAVNLVLPWLLPRIDLAAHLGGFGAGALLAWLVVPRDLDAAAKVGWAPRAAAAAFVAFFIASAAVAALRPASDQRADLLRLVRDVADDPDVGPYVLNDLAWHVALHPSPGAELVVAARGIAERARSEEPSEMNFVDTLATLALCEGDADRAVALEREAIEGDRDPLFFTQLLRFARVAGDGGVLRLGSPPEVRLSLRGRSPKGGPMLHVDVPEGSPGGLEIYARILHPSARVRLLRVRIPPAPTPTTTWERALDGYSDAFTDADLAATAIEVFLLDGGGCRCEASKGVRWQTFPEDDAVLAYPSWSEAGAP